MFLIHAEKKQLTLYTSPSCNNCKYTKYTLQKNKIAFDECSLNEKECAVTMMKKLKKVGYTGKIYLPVIIENDESLVYPIDEHKHNDSTLLFVIQNIVSQKDFYETDSIGNTKENGQPVDKENTDCDFETSYKYLVCANFKDQKEAERFKETLITDGYSHADVLFYKNLFRVYAIQVFENENELELVKKLQEKYKGTYLLNTKP